MRLFYTLIIMMTLLALSFSEARATDIYFSYDGDSRLTSARLGQTNITYQYDQDGNLLERRTDEFAGMSTEVRINGSHTPSVLYGASPVTISLSLRPEGKEGSPGEYYLWVEFSADEDFEDKDCYCFFYPSAWDPCACNHPIPAYVGGLINLRDFLVYQTRAQMVPTGNYVIHFAVDAEMNGLLDEDAARDEVKFSISP